jgi:hypothetical protein
MDGKKNPWYSNLIENQKCNGVQECYQELQTSRMDLENELNLAKKSEMQEEAREEGG